MSISLEKSQYDIKQFANSLALHEGINIVCDSSVFHDRIPIELWNGVTNYPGKLILTPQVQKELELWLRRRPSRPFSNLLDRQSTPALLLDLNSWNGLEQRAYVHYVSLLEIRNHATYFAETIHSGKLNRPLTTSDTEAVRAWVHSNLGERGYLFAKKGERDQAKPGRIPCTDEEVVYVAFALALRTGKDTMILTRDEDLIDQFYRLCYLLDSHYRSYLIGNRYASDPSKFRFEPLPWNGLSRQFFHPGARFVLRDSNLPYSVLPSSFTPVSVECHLVGELYSSIAFLAEREMLKLLHTKGAANGANTRALDGWNCHLLHPSFGGITDSERGFIVARDRMIDLPGETQQVPLLEFTQALFPVERHSDVVEEDAAPES